MMSDRKPLVSVLLSFFSLLRLHVCSALLREAERCGIRRGGQAGAQRTLYAVACMPWFGAGSGRDMAFSHSRMALMLRL